MERFSLIKKQLHELQKLSAGKICLFINGSHEKKNIYFRCLLNNAQGFSIDFLNTIPSVGQSRASSLLFLQTEVLEIDFPEGNAC